MDRRLVRRLALIPAVSLLALSCAKSASADTPINPPSVADWAASIENPLGEWFISQDTDGPAPTEAQFELGHAISERLLAPATPGGWNERTLPHQLANGVVGVLGSEKTGYTVVVGKGSSRSQITAHLLKGLPSASATHLEVIEARWTIKEYESAWRTARSLTWLSSKGATFTIGLDGADQTVEVSVDERVTPSEIEKLRAASPVMEVQRLDAPIARMVGGRASDNNSHWGGADLTRGGSSIRCSSGFSVSGWNTGATYSLTAGHCGYNGNDYYSGPHFFGTMAGRQTYPDKDMARLQGDPSYAPMLYTDGPNDNFTTRQVTSAADGAIGDYVCQSGSSSGSICGIKIAGLNQTLCTFNQLLERTECTDHLALGVRSAGYAVLPGDSGGPVYFRQTSTNRAGIRGIVIGGTSAIDRADITHIYWHRYSDLANSLQVSAVLAG